MNFIFLTESVVVIMNLLLNALFDPRFVEYIFPFNSSNYSH